MEQHCWNVGYSHSSGDGLDPVGEGIDALPCTFNETNSSAYGDGYVTGMGVSAGGDYGSSYPSGSCDGGEYNGSQSKKGMKKNITILQDLNEYLREKCGITIRRIELSGVKRNSCHPRDCKKTSKSYYLVLDKIGVSGWYPNAHILFEKEGYLVDESKRKGYVVINRDAEVLCHYICFCDYHKYKEAGYFAKNKDKMYQAMLSVLSGFYSYYLSCR